MADFLSVENLEKTYQEKPDSLIFAYLASRYVETGDFDRAIEICEKGLEKFPHYAFGHYIYALAHYYLKNYTRAKSELEMALAYEPMNPQGWKILADIHEKLNLAALTQENYLNYYLVDPFSTEAAEKFYERDVARMIGGMGEILSEEGEAEAALEESVEEENPFDELFEPEEKEAAELDLDEVLRETLFDLEESPEKQTETVEQEEEQPAEKQEQAEPLQAAEEVSPEEAELKKEMDELFREFEEGSEISETPESGEEEVLPGEKSEEVGEETSEEELEFPEEFVEEKLGEEGEPSEGEEEEPIDFSAVVADIISEGEQEEEKPTAEEPPQEPDKEVITEDELLKKELFQFPEEEPESTTEEPTTESEEEKPSAQEKSEPSVTPQPQKDETTHIGKPPLLSPTLGEIYIAQGRFEEAIEVFRKLLEKEPNNSRFKRKIEDLQQIIEKKNSLDKED